MKAEKDKVYYLVYVMYEDNTYGNLVINSTIIAMLNAWGSAIVVKNFWPITKEEYDEYTGGR